MRVTLGMDWIMQELCRRNPATSPAFLATSSDVYAVGAAAAQRARERFARRSALTRIAQVLSGGRWFCANGEAGADPARALIDELIP